MIMDDENFVGGSSRVMFLETRMSRRVESGQLQIVYILPRQIS